MAAREPLPADEAMFELPWPSEMPVVAGLPEVEGDKPLSVAWWDAVDAVYYTIAGVAAYSRVEVLTRLAALLPGPDRLGLGARREKHVSAMDPQASDNLKAFMYVVWVATFDVNEAADPHTLFNTAFTDETVAIVAHEASRSTLATRLLTMCSFARDAAMKITSRLDTGNGLLGTDLVCTTFSPLPKVLYEEGVQKEIEMRAPDFDGQAYADQRSQYIYAHDKGTIYTPDPHVIMSDEFYEYFNLTTTPAGELVVRDPNNKTVRRTAAVRWRGLCATSSRTPPPPPHSFPGAPNDSRLFSHAVFFSLVAAGVRVHGAALYGASAGGSRSSPRRG